LKNPVSELFGGGTQFNRRRWVEAPRVADEDIEIGITLVEAADFLTPLEKVKAILT
jgi:hypothetical protein